MLSVASCYRNRHKLRPCGPPWLVCGFNFYPVIVHFSYFHIKLKFPYYSLFIINRSNLYFQVEQITMNITVANDSFSHPVDNETGEDIYAGVFDPLYHIPPLMAALLVIGLNTWVIVLVKTHANLQTNMNLLLCSLALSDLLTGLLSIPLHVSCDVIRETPICVASQLTLRFTSVSTVSHLLAITIDRYIGIKYSLRYNAMVTKKRVLITSVFIWCSSIFASLIQLAFINYAREDIDEENDDVIKHEIRYDVTSLVLYVALPFMIMSTVYVHIFLVILRQYRHIKRYNSPGWLETKRRTHHEWKAVVIFSMMLIMFLACWLPFFTVRLQYNLGNDFYELSYTVVYIFIYLRFFTSVFNPLVHILGKRDFRQAISASRRSLFTRLRSNSLHSSAKTTTV